MTDLAQFIGKPFVLGARGPDAYDCWGLAREVMRCYGVEVPDYFYTTDDPDSIRSLVDYVRETTVLWFPVQVEPRPGDLVMMGMTPRLHHAGVLTEEGVLHTSRKHGAILQPLNQLVYRCVRSYRWAG